jgi:hypothetical protein
MGSSPERSSQVLRYLHPTGLIVSAFTFFHEIPQAGTAGTFIQSTLQQNHLSSFKTTRDTSYNEMTLSVLERTVMLRNM